MNNDLFKIDDSQTNNILVSYLKVSWFIIPLLVFQLVSHFFKFIELEFYQFILVNIGLVCLVLFNVFSKKNWLKHNFYIIQATFLFVLIFFEFLWYIDSPSPRQLFSLLLGITITGIALVKPKNSIVFFSVSLVVLVAINYFKNYEFFQYVNYFIISGICIAAFNYWRYYLLKNIKVSAQSFKSMFDDSVEYIYVVELGSNKIIESNKNAKEYIKHKKINHILDVFSLQEEKQKIQNLITNIHNTPIVSLETDYNTKNPDYAPKQISLRKSIFYNKPVVIVTINLISERKAYENLLKESKENITKILNNIDAFVYSITYLNDGGRQVKFLSQKVEDILEMEVDEIISRFKSNTIKDIGFEDDIPYIEHKLKEANEKLIPQVLVYRIEVDGKIKWVEEKVFPHKSDEGIDHFGIVRDITESKKNELKYVESQKKYKDLFDQSLAGIYKTTIDGEVLEANEAFCKLLGFDSLADLKQHKIRDFYPDEASRNAYLKKLKDEGNLKNYIIVLKNINGDTIIVNNNVSLIDEGDTKVVSGTLIDISELHQTSEALKASEEKYKLLFEQSSNGIMLVDVDHEKVIDANENAAKFFNTSTQFLLSDSIGNIIKDNNKEKVISFFHHSNEKSINIEVVNDKTNKVRYLKLNKVNLLHNNQRILLVIITDISELILKEQQILKTQESFKNIVDSSPTFILIFTDNTLVYTNPQGKTFYQNYLNAASDQLNLIFNKKQLHIIEQVIAEIDKPIDSYTELEIKTESYIKKLAVQAVKTTFNQKDSILLTFRDVSIEVEYNYQKMRAEIAENLNINLEKQIAKRKETEKELLNHQNFIDNILESSIDMIITTDLDNKITTINKSALKRFGYKKEDLIGKDISLISSTKQNYQAIPNTIKDSKKYVGEVVNVDSDGNEFNSFLTATTMKDDNGEVVGFMGISRDLSELEEIKTIINSQNSLINSFFQNDSDIFIWILNKDLEVVSFSQSANNYFKKLNGGKDLEKGKDFITQIQPIIYPKHVDITKQLYLDCLAGEKQNFDAMLTNKKHEKHWVDTHLTPVVLPDGRINELICLGYDITEKKNKIVEVKESEANIRAMVNAIPDFLFKLDVDGKIIDVEVNSAVKKQIFNKKINDKSKIKNKFLNDFFDFKPAFGVKILNYINKTIKNDKVYTQNFDFEINQNKVYYEARYSKINDNEVMVVIRDQTELIENQNKLLESVHEKEVLLKEVHHRVKNNLQIINSILNLQSSYVSDPKILEIILESQNRIRTMSYIHESLYQTENFSSINFKEYIANLLNNLIYSYQINKNVTIVRDIDKVNLHLDQAISCGLILNELITNALKYAFPDEMKGSLLIKIKDLPENKVELVVQDSGIGLPENFDLESTESLGLSLVHTLVDQIDGEVFVKNDNGTKFLIIFEKLVS
ncbi:MAG: PAS domain S-box protein [Putridiphycobacter sp.]